MLAGQSNRCHICKRHGDENCIVVVKLPLFYFSEGAATGATGGANKEMDEKIILLSEKISALVQEAETAGCAGNVEQVCKCACPTQQLPTKYYNF